MRLEELVINAGFRQDLYYRLNVGRIYIPALRERREEILPLAEMFLADISGKKGKKFRHISRGAENILMSYDWPGNIRQLRNVIERAVFMYDTASLEPEHLDVISKSVRSGGDNQRTAVNGIDGGSRTNKTAPEEICDLKLPAGKNFPLNDHIYSIIKKALILNGYNKTRTAEYLNITRRTLYSYLKHIENK